MNRPVLAQGGHVAKAKRRQRRGPMHVTIILPILHGGALSARRGAGPSVPGGALTARAA